LKFERLLETYYAFAPQGLISFLTSVPVWLKEKIFLKKLLRDELRKIDNYYSDKLNPKISIGHKKSLQSV
jgi:carbamoyltransferase